VDAGAAVGSQAISPPSAHLADGEKVFQSACSACHGATARGGRNGAADLLISPKVLGDVNSFADFVRNGNPPAGMPAFDLPLKSIDDLAYYLKSLAAAASRRGNTPFTVTGNAAAGRVFFEGVGTCTRCHSLTGDLQHIGSKYPPLVLQGRIVLPRGNGVHPGLLKIGVKIPGVTDSLKNVHDSPKRARVILSDGRDVEGELVAISDFEVSVRDVSGTVREFSLEKGAATVSVTDPVAGHVALLGKISDRSIHDLTAYLATLK
jgi:mono/diheme cytochrome c family protein